MGDASQNRLPSGRPPWDVWNGARVGGLVGGLIAVGVTLVMSNATFWLVPIGAVIGSFLGYRSEKLKQAKERRDDST